jgi:hypothetical protein
MRGDSRGAKGPFAELIGIEGGVVSGMINFESSGVGALDRRPRHEEHYHEAKARGRGAGAPALPAQGEVGTAARTCQHHTARYARRAALADLFKRDFRGCRPPPNT